MNDPLFDEGIYKQYASKSTQELEEIIDVAFVLEVSSPGADSPLKFERQYTKNIGRTLKVTLEDLSEVKGTLTQVSNGKITLEPEAKKKIKPEAMTLTEKKIQPNDMMKNQPYAEISSKKTENNITIHQE